MEPEPYAPVQQAFEAFASKELALEVVQVEADAAAETDSLAVADIRAGEVPARGNCSHSQELPLA